MSVASPSSSGVSSVPALAPVNRTRLEPKTSDRVHDALVAAIRDLRLPPNTLISETELCRQLGVSRTPIREALVRLVHEDLVQVTPQVGTRVSRIRMSDVSEAWFVRENLEVAAVKVDCSLEERDVRPLRSAIARQEAAQAEHDLDAFFAADEEMHQGIFAMAGYPGAWQAIQRKKIQLDRVRRMSLPEPATLLELLEEHRRIVDAIEAGDTKTAVRLIRAHAGRAIVRAPGLREQHPEWFAD